MSMSLFLALLLAGAQAPDKPQAAPPAPAQAGCRPAAPPPAADQHRIASLLASASGATAETAFHVRSVHEEYEILGALGLCPDTQSLVMHGRRSYDLLRTTDPRTGAPRELWFDISAFFGQEF
jgi:hypothetical protein